MDRALAFARSFLFVPGHRQRMLDKALGLAADALLLDLEDSVPPTEKPAARALVAATIDRATVAGEAAGARCPGLFVRTNAPTSTWFGDDVAAVVRPGLAGLLLPKVESAGAIRLAEGVVAEREAAVGLPPGTVGFLAILETARGIIEAPAIAGASERVAGLAFGAEDFATDLNLPERRNAEGIEFLYARSAIVLAAVSARLAAIDTIWADIRDPEGLVQEARLARRLGFSGKALIHPDQVGPVNDVFRPSAVEVERARRIVEGFAAAEARGEGAVSVDGEMIDYPIVERARRTLARAAAFAPPVTDTAEG